MSSSSRIRNAYNEWADIYETNKNTTRDLNAETIRRAQLQISGKEILELGCGTGLNTEFLCKEATFVTAVDFSENMLRQARKKVTNDNVRFIQADITQPWNFRNELFDLVVVNLVLEHIKDPGPVYREAFRVLKNGGEFYVAELHPYKQLQHSQAKYTDKKTGKEKLVDAFPHSVTEFVNIGVETGFQLRFLKEHQTGEDTIPRLLTLLFKKV